MRIAWFCIPAHGHTNPTLGLVKELTEAGHEVYYFSFDQFREKLERAGAHFISCSEYEPDMEDEDAAERVGKDMAFATELLVKSTLALDEMIEKNIKEICPDLIVSDSVAFWGKLTAMKYRIPYVSSTTTFAFNNYSSKYMKHGIGELVKMLLKMPKINKHLNLLRKQGYPVKGFLEIVSNDNHINTIVYTSKEFQPCSETFSDKYCFIGPSIRPVEKTMEKKADKTIYISMGTVVKNPEIYQRCIEALGGTDYQVIISLGGSTIDCKQVPDNIEIYDSVDQMAVLSIADAFLTHCGMNSTSEALYYQVPLILFPQTPEQGAVAKRVEELGAGIRLKKIDANSLRTTFEKVLSDEGFKESAVKISEGFKKCGGVKEARAYLEKLK